VLADSGAVARRGAEYVVQRAQDAVARRGAFTFAVSGGTTPWAMFASLRGADMPWAQTAIYQVDERIAPEGDPDRNLTQLRASLGDAPTRLLPMPVNEADVDAATARYADELPDRFDLVHLGLGDDGHTASLVPGDPVLEVLDRLVALTGEYRGRRRMTLTYVALARADQLLWLVAGADKRAPLRKLLAQDASIPAGRVEAAASLVIADRAAVAP
jgi:6-phosphogluconolactonase